MLMIGDIAQELYFAAQQRRRDIRPRIKRTFSYALVRAWGTVIQRDLQVAAVIGDLYAGPPGRVHDLPRLRRGRASLRGRARRRAGDAAPRRPPARADRGRRRGRRPRPYHLVVLSDHGQSQGATFLDRYGEHASRTSSRRRAAPRTVEAQDAAQRRVAQLPRRRADRGRRRRGHARPRRPGRDPRQAGRRRGPPRRRGPAARDGAATMTSCRSSRSWRRAAWA